MDPNTGEIPHLMVNERGKMEPVADFYVAPTMAQEGAGWAGGRAGERVGQRLCG